MKKSFLTLAVAIAAVAFISVSCTKDDVTNPTITITAGTDVIDLGDTWVDAGATANDDKDGDLTSQIVVSGTVDGTKVGIYEIEYTVSDEAGNTITETRTVTVRANKLAGTYSVHLTIGAWDTTYSETVTSSVDYNAINISNFCAFDGLPLVKPTISGSSVVFNQVINYDWDNDGTSTNATISGTSLNGYSVVTSPTVDARLGTLNYTIEYGGGYTDVCTAVYTKQ